MTRRRSATTALCPGIHTEIDTARLRDTAQPRIAQRLGRLHQLTSTDRRPGDPHPPRPPEPPRRPVAGEDHAWRSEVMSRPSTPPGPNAPLDVCGGYGLELPPFGGVDIEDQRLSLRARDRTTQQSPAEPICIWGSVVRKSSARRSAELRTGQQSPTDEVPGQPSHSTNPNEPQCQHLNA
ncbi:MAG: hypothetical protein QOI06_938 [Nocardioidaceae bacterium]|nr:hypothetical protein [Nocardioidaceae bacterium]